MMMNTITLSNGVEMPLLGYGVFKVAPQECERCVSDALNVGYRLIDTAQAYFNEEGVGNAISKSSVPRQDIFLVTKVWISNAGEEKAAASIDESLRKLKTDYIDLLLIHQAYGDVFGSWRAMEKACREGKVRAIGVSNFQAGRFFDFAHYVDIKPMVNQLQCNPLVQQQGIVAIPKSTHVERMRQNLDIFDFTLSEEEMRKISTLNQHDAGTVNFSDPQFVKYLIETYG